MKIGLKLKANNLNLMKEYQDFFDFYELYIGPNFNPALLKSNKYKIRVHAAHYEDGFDPSNIKKKKLNQKLIKKAIEIADIVNSPWIIVHPGHRFSPKSEKNMLNFFDENWDPRIIFENCPAIDYTENKRRYLFSLPEEMKQLLKKYNTGFVLDFGHAILTANVLKKDPIKIINDFYDLKPKCFHLSGIDINSKFDTHKNLFEVNNNFDFVKKVGKSKYLTLETYKTDIPTRDTQLRNIKLIQ